MSGAGAPAGLARGLTHDGDFARSPRGSFVRSMGYSSGAQSGAQARPVVGIASTGGGFNDRHRGVPEPVCVVKPRRVGESAADGTR